MFENPRRGRQARNFTTNVPKILDLKSSSEQIFFRKLPLGAPENPRTTIVYLSYFINWYIMYLLLIGFKGKEKHKEYLKDTNKYK